MLAAKANQVETMKALIAGGADPKLKAQDGSSLLMAAVGSGHVEAVKLAYEYDQDVKFTTETGTTLMHAAVTGTMQNSTQDEIVKVVQFLADKGAPARREKRPGPHADCSRERAAHRQGGRPADRVDREERRQAQDLPKR